jgi:hypothetical protein
MNEERGSIAWHVILDAGEPKARASTELPEAQRLPAGARAAAEPNRMSLRGNGAGCRCYSGRSPVLLNRK